MCDSSCVASFAFLIPECLLISFILWILSYCCFWTAAQFDAASPYCARFSFMMNVLDWSYLASGLCLAHPCHPGVHAATWKYLNSQIFSSFNEGRDGIFTIFRDLNEAIQMISPQRNGCLRRCLKTSWAQWEDTCVKTDWRANLFQVPSPKRLWVLWSHILWCPCSRKEKKNKKLHDSLIARIIENPLKQRDLFDVAQQNGLMVCVTVSESESVCAFMHVCIMA